MRVSPFGNPRVDAYFQLSVAYRRLSRPSSAIGAKAFTLCSFSLEQLPLLVLLNFQIRFFAWASQIIVLGCVVKKTFGFFNSTVVFTTRASRLCGYIVVSHFSERPSNLSIKKSYSIQLSVFRYTNLFGFQWTLALALCAIARLAMLSHAKRFGRPKWTRTTDLVLIRHAL